MVYPRCDAAIQAGACRRQRDHLSDIISGPATTYRSELIEASYSRR